MFRMKSVVGAVTLATMVATSAFAADTGVLAPGKPAGVKNAQVGTGFLLLPHQDQKYNQEHQYPDSPIGDAGFVPHHRQDRHAGKCGQSQQGYVFKSFMFPLFRYGCFFFLGLKKCA